MPFEIQLNGELRTFDPSVQTLSDLVVALKVSPGGLIAEHNGALIHSKDFQTSLVQQGDTIELIQFMGGGELKPVNNCPK